nr:hypothetical protein CFP56_68051 [Quercus suber]
MANLEELWSQFSLTEDEEGREEVAHQDEAVIHWPAVVFKKANDIESIPFLEFDHVTFWVQIHNVPMKSLNHETGEAIGKTIGSVILVADAEDDGTSEEFLCVRVAIDITKPLPKLLQIMV